MMGMYDLDSVHGDEHDQLPVMEVEEIDAKLVDFFLDYTADKADALAVKASGNESFNLALYTLASVDMKRKTDRGNEILIGSAITLNEICERLIREMIQDEEL